MFTKEIKLEQISAEEFDKLSSIWGLTEKAKKGRNYHKIGNTIVYDSPSGQVDYNAFIRSIAEHPYALSIAVREGNEWHRPYVKDLTDEKITELSEIAKKDPKKQNFLELKLRRDRQFGDNVVGKQATIEFAEIGGALVCYQIKVPKELLFMFNFNPDTYNNINFGLWKPEPDQPHYRLK